MNLVSSWTTLWARLTAWAPNLGTILAIIGMIIIIVALIAWGWQKRRGQGRGFPWWATAVGLILAGPTLVLPAILGVLQAFVAIAIDIFKWIAAAL